VIDDLTIAIGDIGSIPAIMPVMAAAFDPANGEAWTAVQCAGMLALPGGQLLIASAGQDVRGFALLRETFDEAELLLLAVHPDHQGKGAGRAIVSHIVDSLRQSGVRKVHIEVRENNPARRFYTSLAFEIVGRRQNYYRGLNGERMDAVTLSRILD
jgi:ribosomal-protein-alanine N-acetyltransferase